MEVMIFQRAVFFVFIGMLSFSLNAEWSVGYFSGYKGLVSYKHQAAILHPSFWLGFSLDPRDPYPFQVQPYTGPYQGVATLNVQFIPGQHGVDLRYGYRREDQLKEDLAKDQYGNTKDPSATYHRKTARMAYIYCPINSVHINSGVTWWDKSDRGAKSSLMPSIGLTYTY
jgi:hypothetical protein